MISLFNNVPKKVFIVGITLIALSFVGGVTLFIQSKLVSNRENKESKDLVKKASEENPLIKKILDASLARNYDVIVETADEIIKNSKSPNDTSLAEMYKASVFFLRRDYKQGSALYYSIFNNKSYPSITRATALNTVMQQYNGTKDKNLFVDIIPDVAAKKDEEIKDFIYTKIYDVYALGHASAWVGARSLLKIDPSKKEEALMLYMKHYAEIESDIEKQSKGVASAYIVPNLHLARARLSIIAYRRFGVLPRTTVTEEFEKAVNLAVTALNPVTTQFALIEYTNFLGEEKMKEKGEATFSILKSQNLDAMVLASLVRGDWKTNWPGLYYLYGTSKVVKDFVKEYRIKI